MKLINEKEIDEILANYNVLSNTEHNFALGIKYGINFAEQKLTPLFIEFANEAIIAERNCCAVPIEQLFEQFIQERTMKELEQLLQFKDESEIEELRNELKE